MDPAGDPARRRRPSGARGGGGEALGAPSQRGALGLRPARRPAREIVEREGVTAAARRSARWRRRAASPPTPCSGRPRPLRGNTFASSHPRGTCPRLGMPIAEVLAPSARPRGAVLPHGVPRSTSAGGRTASPPCTAGCVAPDVHGLYPGKSEEEVPIGHITNGVHVRTWLAADMYFLLQQHPGPRLADTSAARPRDEDRQGDAEIWEVHQGAAKARLYPSPAAAWPTAASVWARGDRARSAGPCSLASPAAATYKRADLLTRDLDRLDRLVNHPQRPVHRLRRQGLSARRRGSGAGAEGGALRGRSFAGKLVFIENYTMHVGRQPAGGRLAEHGRAGPPRPGGHQRRSGDRTVC